MRRLLVLALLAASAVQLRPAVAADDQVVTTVGTAYVPPVVVVSEGQGLDLENPDLLPHDVRARDRGADGQPLFQSAIAGPLGGTADVVGVEALDPGSYAFFCTIHPWMHGVLSVTAADGPGPPPLPTPNGPAGALAVAAVVPTPTSVTVHDGSLYAASYATGTVYELPILEGGLLGPAAAYATGVNLPLGIVFDDAGWLYVADSHPSARPDRSTAGRVWAIPPGGGDTSAIGEVVVDELPNGRHNTNGMAVRGGRLYITNGNSTDDGVDVNQPEEPLSGTLLSAALDARGLVVGEPDDPLPAGLVVEATGMRNVYDVAFRPGTDEAWVPTNGPDMQDPWGEDLLHRAEVTGPAPDFGFPGCLYMAGPGGPTDPIWQQNANPEAPVCDPGHTPPEVTLGLHVSADGLAFGSEEEWGGDLYIAEFGNFFGVAEIGIVGHKIVRVPIDGDGNTGAPVDFLPGVTPLDLVFGPSGTGMYVADFAAGILLVKPVS